MLRGCMKAIIRTLTYFKNETVAIPQQIIFSTVRDTHDYHKFIPWCKKSTIINKISQNENYTQLTISFNDLKEISYTSHVVIEQNGDCLTITSICKDSPLKYLKSVWTIKKQNESETNISYFLDFQFDSLLYQLTSSIFLKTMGKSMMEIFLKRSRQRKMQRIMRNNSQLVHEFRKNNTTRKEQQLKQDFQEEINKKLEQYVKLKPVLNKIIQSNQQISAQIKKLANRLSKTNNFNQKMNFQVKNLLTHHNILPESEVFKQFQ